MIPILLAIVVGQTPLLDACNSVPYERVSAIPIAHWPDMAVASLPEDRLHNIAKRLGTISSRPRLWLDAAWVAKVRTIQERTGVEHVIVLAPYTDAMARDDEFEDKGEALDMRAGDPRDWSDCDWLTIFAGELEAIALGVADAPTAFYIDCEAFHSSRNYDWPPDLATEVVARINHLIRTIKRRIPQVQVEWNDAGGYRELDDGPIESLGCVGRADEIRTDYWSQIMFYDLGTNRTLLDLARRDRPIGATISLGIRAAPNGRPTSEQIYGTAYAGGIATDARESWMIGRCLGGHKPGWRQVSRVLVENQATTEHWTAFLRGMRGDSYE